MSESELSEMSELTESDKRPQRIALIQGASGGVGRALVEQVLASGAYQRVIVTSRDVACSGWSGDPRVQLVTLDLSDDDSIARAASEVSVIADRLHLVITTAGILRVDEALGTTPEKKLTDLTRAALSEVFSVNCFGPMLWYAALRRLFRHREPLVIATLSARVGSISDNRLGGWYSYRASKAALNMMTKTLSLELRRSNPESIVVGLHPGTVNTSLSKPFQARVPPERLFSPERSASYLWAVISELTPAKSGQVFAWDGAEIEP